MGCTSVSGTPIAVTSSANKWLSHNQRVKSVLRCVQVIAAANPDVLPTRNPIQCYGCDVVGSDFKEGCPRPGGMRNLFEFQQTDPSYSAPSAVRIHRDCQKFGFVRNTTTKRKRAFPFDE